MAQYSHLLATCPYAWVSISVIRNSQLGLMWRWMRMWNIDSAWLKVSVHMWLMMRRVFANRAALRECQEEERELCLSHGYAFSTLPPMRPSHLSLGIGSLLKPDLRWINDLVLSNLGPLGLTVTNSRLSKSLTHNNHGYRVKPWKPVHCLSDQMNKAQKVNSIPSVSSLSRFTGCS